MNLYSPYILRIGTGDGRDEGDVEWTLCYRKSKDAWRKHFEKDPDWKIIGWETIAVEAEED